MNQQLPVAGNQCQPVSGNPLWQTAAMTGKTPSERLRAARIAAGYETVMAAAQAMGANYSTYAAHENGEKGLTRAGVRYARFFRVSLDWLLTGRGEMRGASEALVPVIGVVAAGQASIPAEAEGDLLGHVAAPAGESVHAFRVQGESMWPRFLEGEFILVDARPVNPQKLLGRYAMVQLMDGARMLKIIRLGSRPGLWTLESHNAPPLTDVELLAAWGWRGTLPG